MHRRSFARAERDSLSLWPLPDVELVFLDLLGGLQNHRVQHSRDLFAQSLPAGGPEFLAPFDSLRDDTEKMDGSLVFTIAFGRIAFAEPCIRQRRSLLYVYCTFEKLKFTMCSRAA